MSENPASLLPLRGSTGALAGGSTKALADALDGLGIPSGPAVLERWRSGGGWRGQHLRDARARWLRRQGWQVECWKSGATFYLMGLAPEASQPEPLLCDVRGAELGARFSIQTPATSPAEGFDESAEALEALLVRARAAEAS